MFLCCGFRQRIFQEAFHEQAAAILCGLHPLLYGAVRRRQHHLGGRSHGRDDPAPALKSDPDCRRAAIRKDAVRTKGAAAFADGLPCRRGQEVEPTARQGSQAKHLSTAEFKAKKIIEQASVQADHKLQVAQLHADDIIALANSQADHKLQMAQSQADELVAQANSQADNAKARAQEYLDGVIQSVESEKTKPIPKRRRQAEEEISLLRTENEALRQSKSIADRDRKDLFEQLQKAERAGKGKEQAFKMVTDMLSAYPDEFDALLSKSRAKKSGALPFKSSGFDRGGK